jgi:hypothetical protein
MSDSHAREGQIERARRLRDLIEDLKSGKHSQPPGRKPSLREQIAKRAQDVQRAKESPGK